MTRADLIQKRILARAGRGDDVTKWSEEEREFIRNGGDIGRDPVGKSYLNTVIRLCAVCEKSAADVGVSSLKACGRCKASFYCSTACQKQDWKQGHKRQCDLTLAQRKSWTEASDNPVFAKAFEL